MSYVVWFLIYLYGCSMLLAISTVVKQVPLWLICLNISGSFSLFAGPYNARFLYLGFVILLLSAYLNGHLILGKTNISHLLMRLIISLALTVLYHLFSH